MQFTEEQMVCYVTDCKNKDTKFIDCTRGPLYDPRFYCEDHYDEAHENERRISRDSWLVYQRSIVSNLKAKLLEEQAKLDDLEKAREIEELQNV